MLNTLEELLSLVALVYEGRDAPRPFRLLAAVQRVQTGKTPQSEARAVRSTIKYIQKAIESGDPIHEVLGASIPTDMDSDLVRKTRGMIGQLLIGQLAEQAFETMYRERLGTTELRLEDNREARHDTDYRVLNGLNRPVFRINIKFHGTRFRNAKTLVGLDPDDCFALATYKIHQALIKQEREVLPYLFVIVSALDLTADQVARAVPVELIQLSALVNAATIPGKRDVEDAIVTYLSSSAAQAEVREAVSEYAGLVRRANWRVLSARKADKLLRTRLFERVYAVRVRAFARNYRNAELDMHFSLQEDLTSLGTLLDLMRDTGLQGVTGHLERGTI